MAKIVFDLDGTLIDSVYDLHGIANAIMDQEGLPHVSVDQARDFIGKGVDVFVAKLRAVQGISDADHERILATFSDRYRQAFHLTKLYPNVEKALQDLIEAGHHLGICTNKPGDASRAVLAHLGLDKYFSTVWCGDSLPVKKPDPTPLNTAFAELPSGPEIYVGDSEVDAETAQRAMVPFLIYSEGYRKSPLKDLPHTAAFSDFAELPDLVQNLLKEAA